MKGKIWTKGKGVYKEKVSVVDESKSLRRKRYIFGMEGSAEEECSRLLGEPGAWFYRIAKCVRQFEKDYGVKITDILINSSNRYPLFGVLKNFFDVKEYIEGLPEIGDMADRFIERCKKEGMGSFSRKEGKVGDFAISIYGLGTFRVNCSQAECGTILNIRVLDFVIPDLEDLQCPKAYMEFLEQDILEEVDIDLGKRKVKSYEVGKGGLIIHAGETGSGKTTFIASELKFFADRISGLIVTYERPIEYIFLPPYSARTIQYELGVHLNDEEIYYHFLRSSPSVGFFYEVKTKDEFVQVLDLASRGHLVLTTMHSSSVLEVFSNFASFDAEVRGLFVNTIKGIVCHKLVTDENGMIVPLYEIFLKKGRVDPVMSLFFKGDMVALKNFLYKERGFDNFFSFSEYLTKGIERGILDKSLLRYNKIIMIR